jgi:hypothetical protein
LHGDIVGQSVMTNHFQWPRHFHILINVQDHGTHQR